MSETVFKAKNGYILRENAHGSIRIYGSLEGVNLLTGCDFLGILDVNALSEYLQHKRDEELGRWRWPDHPDYVVYPKEPTLTNPKSDVRVVHETTGRSKDVELSIIREYGAGTWFGEAALAYSAAHPEPKPWHDAKNGEVWVVTTRSAGREFSVQATYHRTKGVVLRSCGGTEYSRDDADIKTARRIYPEGEDK